jgi:hypothetical protein
MKYMEDLKFSKPIVEEVKAKEKTLWMQKLNKNKILLAVILLIIIVIAVVVGLYFKMGDIQTASKDSEKNIQEVIDKVSKLVLLPTDEQPTVATISDVEKLAGQPFFANAQNGDKVLIYTKAMKAILYSPTKNIIVEIAPLNMSGDTKSP